jgi:hypothetical protein
MAAIAMESHPDRTASGGDAVVSEWGKHGLA